MLVVVVAGGASCCLATSLCGDVDVCAMRLYGLTWEQVGFISLFMGGGMVVISMRFARLWKEACGPKAGGSIRAPQRCPAIKALQTKGGRHFKDPIRAGLVAHISLAQRSHERQDEEEPFVNLCSAIRHLLSFKKKKKNAYIGAVSIWIFMIRQKWVKRKGRRFKFVIYYCHLLDMKYAGRLPLKKFLKNIKRLWYSSQRRYFLFHSCHTGSRAHLFPRSFHSQIL